MELNLFLNWNGNKHHSKTEIVYSKGENVIVCWTTRPVSEIKELLGVDLERCSIVSTSYDVGDNETILLPFAVTPWTSNSRYVPREYFL